LKLFFFFIASPLIINRLEEYSKNPDFSDSDEEEQEYSESKITFYFLILDDENHDFDSQDVEK